MDTTNPTTLTVKSSPRDVFLHLMLFVALYVSVVSLINLLFQYVNFWQQDPLTFYYESVVNSVRWSASMLLVMFAVYMGVSWFIHKDFEASPEKKNIKIRKWLVYLTLFVSALTVIIDVITLLYQYLGGDLTLSFFLKILVVLVVSGGVFAYYLWDVKQETTDSKKLKLLAWGVSVFVLAAIVCSAFVVGSPAVQRERRFDETRTNHLQTLQNEIMSFWTKKGILPGNLSELGSSISGFIPPTDPETNQPYEYNVKSALTFELCANFKQDNLQSQDSRVPKPLYGDVYNQNWSHGQGRVCFERTIDPQRDMIPVPVQLK